MYILHLVFFFVSGFGRDIKCCSVVFIILPDRNKTKQIKRMAKMRSMCTVAFMYVYLMYI